MSAAGYRAEIHRAVSDAEERVRKVLVKEAEGGRYDGIEFAQSVGLRLKELKDLTSPTAPGESAASADYVPRAITVVKSRGKYPRFAIADGTLEKTGWAKKKKAEYTQRVPHHTFERVTAALDALAEEDSGTIATERILAGVDALGPQAIPTYQTYTVLNFLRTKKVVRVAARGEYVLPADVKIKAKAAWSNGATP